ncbi:unnamed protein product [Orchesella dallaii]|uniref:Uncharacterized protein n=1 Tax=Orchesella dallaii TaxID=48710 RepID=A0ABP1R8J1_9HEXA
MAVTPNADALMKRKLVEIEDNEPSNGKAIKLEEASDSEESANDADATLKSKNVSGENLEVHDAASETEDFTTASPSAAENNTTEDNEMEEGEGVAGNENETAVHKTASSDIQNEKSTPPNEAEASLNNQTSVGTQTSYLIKSESDDNEPPPNSEIEVADGSARDEPWLEFLLMPTNRTTAEDGEDNTGNEPAAENPTINDIQSENNPDATTEDAAATLDNESIAKPPQNISRGNERAENSRIANSRSCENDANVPSSARETRRRSKRLTVMKSDVKGNVTKDAEVPGTSKVTTKSRVPEEPHTRSRAREDVIQSPDIIKTMNEIEAKRQAVMAGITPIQLTKYKIGMEYIRKNRNKNINNSTALSNAMCFTYDVRRPLTVAEVLEVYELLEKYPALKLYMQMQLEVGRIKLIVDMDEYENNVISKLLPNLKRPCNHKKQKNFCSETKNTSNMNADDQVAVSLYVHLCQVSRRSGRDLHKILKSPPKEDTVNVDESDSSQSTTRKATNKKKKSKEMRPQPVIVAKSQTTSLFDKEGFNVVCEGEQILENVSFRKAVFAVFYCYHIFHIDYDRKGCDKLIFKKFD